MELIYLCIYFLQILRQDLDNHLHDFMQQHLLLLLSDSVENKKNIDELSTNNQLLTNQLNRDSVEHKKRIDELFTENKRLNQKLKETKADLNLFIENSDKISDEQMISKLVDHCVTDVCNDFNEILIERYNHYLQKSSKIASPNINNSLLRKFRSFEEILVEAEVQKGIDQFSKELQEINNNLIQDEVLHAYKRSKIDNIDDLNKIKTILPNSCSCWKDANEKMKIYVDICCNFEHMKQGLKLANYTERRIGKLAPSIQVLVQQRDLAIQDENKCLSISSYPYHYYKITLASLPVTHIIKSASGVDIDVTITISPKHNVSLTFKADANGRYTVVYPVLVDAAGQHQLRLKCAVKCREYICGQSINELKVMGYIVNDGFVLVITVAHNCHGKREKLTARERRPRQERKAHGKRKKATAREKSSRQKKEGHGKREKLTARERRPRQERKVHGKRKKPRQERKAHGKRKKATAREKSSRQEKEGHGKREKLTARERRPRQERKVHGKRKKATAREKSSRQEKEGTAREKSSRQERRRPRQNRKGRSCKDRLRFVFCKVKMVYTVQGYWNIIIIIINNGEERSR